MGTVLEFIKVMEITLLANGQTTIRLKALKYSKVALPSKGHSSIRNCTKVFTLKLMEQFMKANMWVDCGMVQKEN